MTSDAVADAFELHRLTELLPVSAKLRARNFHRAITFRGEPPKTEFIAQWVVGHECVESSSFPNNFLTRGGENLGECGGFFIVEHMPHRCCQ